MFSSKVLSTDEIVEQINNEKRKRFFVLVGRKLSDRELVAVAKKCKYKTITESLKHTLDVVK